MIGFVMVYTQPTIGSEKGARTSGSTIRKNRIASGIQNRNWMMKP